MGLKKVALVIFFISILIPQDLYAGDFGGSKEPVVTILAPTANQEVSGTSFVVQAQVIDDAAVKKVVFELPGQGTIELSSWGRGDHIYSVQWDTTLVADGKHRVYVTGYDWKDRKRKEFVDVFVKNEIVPPSDTTPPIIAISSPTDSNVTDIILLTASASDPESGIASVQFIVNDNSMGLPDTSAPFSFDLDTMTFPTGTVLSIKAVAVNGEGLSDTSATVSVTVSHPPIGNQPPVITLVQPQEGDVITGIMTAEARAEDSDGVAYVEFHVNGVKRRTDDRAPYTYTHFVEKLNVGVNTVEIRAYDNLGAENTRAFQITYSPTDTVNPAIRLEEPVDGNVVSGVVRLLANASDNGPMEKVEFFVNGIGRVGTVFPPDSGTLYEHYWNSEDIADEDYSIYARAIDEAGNVTDTSDRMITVQNQPPTSPVELFNGWDWSFPYEVQPEPYSGLIAGGKTKPSTPRITHKRYDTTWNRLNPNENQYAFDAEFFGVGKGNQDYAFKEVDPNDTTGTKFKGVMVRLKSSNVGPNNVNGVKVGDGEAPNDEPAVPLWVRQKCLNEANGDTAYYSEVDVKGGSGTNRRYHATPWSPCVQREYQNFIDAFAAFQNGLLTYDPRMIGMYITGVSKASGEEMAVQGPGMENLRIAAKLSTKSQTATKTIKAFEDRATWWAEKFGDQQQYKLVMVGYDGLDSLPSSDAKRVEDKLKYGIDFVGPGIGLRGGGPEKYWVRVNDRGHNLYGDEKGYVISKLDDPLITGKRYFGGEMEVFQFYTDQYDLDGDGNKTEMHPLAQEYYRTSVLVTLASGNNFLWTNSQVVDGLDTEMTEYWQQVAGKKADELSDVWSAPYYFAMNRTSPGANKKSCGGTNDPVLKNIERGLYQRNIEGFAVAEPTRHRRRIDEHWDCEDNMPDPEEGSAWVGGNHDPYRDIEERDIKDYDSMGEFTAHKVDQNTGKLAYFVDPLFMNSSQTADMLLKVTFTNRGDNALPWHVTYSSASGMKQTAEVTGDSSKGDVVTATFELKNFKPTDDGESFSSILRDNLNGVDIMIEADLGESGMGDDLEIHFIRLVKKNL